MAYITKLRKAVQFFIVTLVILAVGFVILRYFFPSFNIVANIVSGTLAGIAVIIIGGILIISFIVMAFLSFGIH